MGIDFQNPSYGSTQWGVKLNRALDAIKAQAVSAADVDAAVAASVSDDPAVTQAAATRVVAVASDAAMAANVGNPTSATAGALSATIGPQTGRPVIWDTDWYTDVDDVVAARILAYYERIGQIDVLASIVDTTAPLGAPSLDAFWRAEGRPMQIGQVAGVYSDLSALGPYQTAMAANTSHYGTDASQFPDAVTVYRTALAKATAKVDIIEVGYLSALWALMQSPADAISPLTGLQLIAAKVGKLWVMGGRYPSGAENNFNRSALAIQAAQYVVNNWPASVPVTFLGFEAGLPVITGAQLGSLVPTTDVVRKAMVDHGSANGRPSWDPMLTALACIGDEAAAGYTTVRGTNVVNADGSNTFTTSATGPHRYVVKAKTDAAFTADLDALLVPGRQPIPDVTAARAWSRPVGRTLQPIVGSTAITVPKLVAALKASTAGVADGALVASVPAGAAGPAWTQATTGRQPTYRAAVSGRAALEFAGAQQLVSAAAIASGGAMTIVARVMWPTLPTANQTFAASDIGTAGTVGQRLWHAKGIAGALVQGAVFSNAGGRVDSSAASLVAGQWHIITLRYDAAALEVLVDGVSNGATPITPTPGADSGTQPVTVGGRDTTLAEALTGYLAELRIYSNKASDSQLAGLVSDM